MIKPKKLILFGISVFLLICFSSIAIVKADDAYEENDTFYEAYTAALITYYSTLDISDDDDDWFKIYIPSGNNLTAQIDWSSASYDLNLYLYDSSQNLLDSSTGNTNSELVSIECITITQYYYLEIKLMNTGTDIDYIFSTNCQAACNPAPPFFPFGNYFLIFAGIAIIGLISFILIKRKKLFKTL